MSENLVVDTIIERMSSLHGFGLNLTENTKHHLNAIKDKCSGSQKLDLSDTKTLEWVEQVTDLFYLVDDLCADIALFQKQTNVMFASNCKRTPLLQLKRIEKQVLDLVASMENLKVFPKHDAEEEEAETTERGYVKKFIMENISNRKEGLVRAVVTFGVGVMKKTRLAEHVCKDKEVKSGFDEVMLVDSGNLQWNYAGKRKGFLLVLDCFQNENGEEWLKFAEKVKEVATTSSGGGALIVTTASLAVARLVGSSFEQTQFLFDWLSPSASPLEQPTFERIAETIESLRDMFEEKVAGSLETLAKLVRCQKPDTEADINELKQEFLQEMQLKHYSDLNLVDWSLRQCYAYSLLISTSEHTVKREKLIRLWMAEGFLGHSSSSKEPEDLGAEYVEKFLDMSIFKINTDSQGREICIYSMGAFSLDRHNIYMKERGEINKEVRRLMVSPELDVSKGIPRSVLRTNKNLCTFLLEKQDWSPNQAMFSWFACDEVFSEFKQLRVLTLKNLGMTVLPDSIGNLKSLRYLDLSHNKLNTLPNCIGEFQHLQTLLLSHCYKLSQLPDGVKHFQSLRHLEVDQCLNLMHIPSAIKKQTQLRSLPQFVASNRNGVGELLHLNEIRGELEISHLERLKFKQSEDAAHAYLKEKQHLKGLTLRWNHSDADGKNEKDSLEEDNHDQIMLEHLQPHPNLKRLSVIGYGGKHFAGWLSTLENLVEISFYNCPKIQSLSTLVLDSLQKLTLSSLDSLEFITDKAGKDLKLEKVKISDCPNLTSWWESGAQNTVFTDISELVIENCPKLVSMPLFPKLNNRLVLNGSNMEPLLNTLRHKSKESDSSPPLSGLKTLRIVNADEKQYPRQQELLKNLTSLSKLEIMDCKSLKSIKGWKHLTSLDTLIISNCTDIDLPDEEWKGLQGLEDLVIENMPDMKSLPGVKHLYSSYCLRCLEIKNCAKLSSVPDGSDQEDFFTIVVIDDCPELASLPESFRNVVLNIRNCPLLEAWKASAKNSAATDNSQSSPPLVRSS